MESNCACGERAEKYVGICGGCVQGYKDRARMLVTQAVKTGVLPWLGGGEVACVDCGLPAQCYDHRDYRRPLWVSALCRRCNRGRGPANGRWSHMQHKLRCLRCGHLWLPRMEGRPVACPRCHSPIWDKPRPEPAPGGKKHHRVALFEALRQAGRIGLERHLDALEVRYYLRKTRIWIKATGYSWQ